MWHKAISVVCPVRIRLIINGLYSFSFYTALCVCLTIFSLIVTVCVCIYIYIYIYTHTHGVMIIVETNGIVQILDEAAYVPLCANTLGKGMNLVFSSPSPVMGKLSSQALVKQPVV